MKVSYLENIYFTGLGRNLFKDNQPELHNRSSSEVQIQHPMHYRLPSLMGLGENKNELEDTDEGITFDELILNASYTEEPKIKDGQESYTEQMIESNSHLFESTMDTRRRIKVTYCSRDNLTPVIKDSNIELSDTPELDAGRPVIASSRNEVKKHKIGLHKNEDKLDIQKPLEREIRPQQDNRIPVIEVVEQDDARGYRPDKTVFANSVSQLARINSSNQEPNKNKQKPFLKPFALLGQESSEHPWYITQKTALDKPQKEKKQALLDVTEQGSTDESTNNIRNIELIKEPTGKQSLNAYFLAKSLTKSETHMISGSGQKQESLKQPHPQKIKIAGIEKEKAGIPLEIERQGQLEELDAGIRANRVVQRPRSQRNLNDRFFIESLRKSETEIAKIAKDTTLVSQKLDEHIRNEKTAPTQTVFLPGRPISHNLGGWSYLKRNFIR